jgi:hypothetical protein
MWKVHKLTVVGKGYAKEIGLSRDRLLFCSVVKTNPDKFWPAVNGYYPWLGPVCNTEEAAQLELSKYLNHVEAEVARLNQE